MSRLGDLCLVCGHIRDEHWVSGRLQCVPGCPCSGLAARYEEPVCPCAECAGAGVIHKMGGIICARCRRILAYR